MIAFYQSTILGAPKIEYTFDIHTYDQSDLTENKPYLTYFQLICGKSPVNTISLNLEQIGTPTVNKNSVLNMDSSTAAIMGTMVTINYQLTVPIDNF